MKEIANSRDGTELRIGIVRARFNEDVGLAELEPAACISWSSAVHDDDITVVSVPGRSKCRSSCASSPRPTTSMP